MATILETYWNIKVNIDSEMKNTKLDPIQIRQYQELLYRIEVLQVCQMFQRSAPESTDAKALVTHYQMLDAFIEALTLERLRHDNSNEDAQTKCDTAHGSFRRVIEDYRRRFGSFTPGNDAGRYSKEVSSVLQSVLPAWIQYRQTCIELSKEAS